MVVLAMITNKNNHKSNNQPATFLDVQVNGNSGKQ
jgi:hypothetical protein